MHPNNFLRVAFQRYSSLLLDKKIFAFWQLQTGTILVLAYALYKI